MKIVKHPNFPDTQFTVEDNKVDEWKSQGWIPLLNDEQEQRLAEIQGEVDAKLCPTCGAAGDEPCHTASGAPAKKRHADRPA